MSEHVKKAATKYFETIEPDAATSDAFVALFAPSARFEDPIGGPRLEGEKGLRAFHKGLCRAWASLRMEPQRIIVRGDRAAVLWHAHGQAATGSAIDFDGMNIIEVDDDGLIRSLEGYWDFEDVIAQM